MRAILVAVALAAGCGGKDDPGFPPVESKWQIVGDAVECSSAVDETWLPDAGNALRHACTWTNVTVAGVPTCGVTLVFERADASSPWALVSTFILDCPS